jgi:hypothetical protein
VSRVRHRARWRALFAPAVTEEQIIVAAEITTEGGDFEQLEPIVSAAEQEW